MHPGHQLLVKHTRTPQKASELARSAAPLITLLLGANAACFFSSKKWIFSTAASVTRN